MAKKELKVNLKMIINLSLIFIIIIMIPLVISIKKSNDAQKVLMGRDGGQEFSMQFLSLENNKENMVYSPLSIKYALAMLRDGASGNTKAQIDNVLKDESLTKYSSIRKVFSLANAVFIRDSFEEYVKKDYRNALTENYNAELILDPFKNADNINEWIEDKTFGIIKNMLKDEQVSDLDTEMILVNSLAIDMDWKSSFDTSKTSGKDFTKEDGSKISVTMMNKEDFTDDVSYYKDDNVTVLSMDFKEYNDNKFEFIAIMPEKDLSGFSKKFTEEKLNYITENLTLASDTNKGLNILIPKFSFDYNLSLKNDLSSLGIVDAFDEEKADFSNMSDKELYVSDAIHKANIEFSEDGAKAAATTAIYMTDEAGAEEVKKTKEITIDKPFMFVIRDKDTKEIWFVGNVYEPNLWKNDKSTYEYR